MFNAALTIFGSFLIEMSAVEPPSDLEDRIARSRRNLTNAALALAALDWNNQTLTKCKGYVEHLIRMLDQCGEFAPASLKPPSPLTTNSTIVSTDRDSANDLGSLNPLWQQAIDPLPSDIHNFDNAAALGCPEMDLNSLLNGDPQLEQFFIFGGA